MKRARAIATLAAAGLLLAACAETGTDGGEAGALPQLSEGWTIDPGGDLNAFFECLEAEGATLVSAHRGGPYAGYPENAVETFVNVLRAAPAIMEIDVTASADGVHYLMHDDTLERTTTAAGGADALAWSEIKSARLEDNNGKSTPYTPPTLADALRWGAGRTIFQIDFKRAARYEDVIEEIYRQNAEDRVILIAYSLASARKLHRLAPDMMISLNVDSQSDLNRAVAAGVPADRLLGFTGLDAPRPRLFDILNDRDVEVVFATLGGRDSLDNEIARSGDDSPYADISKLGADIIATDRPIEAYLALNDAGRAPEDGVCGISKL